MVQCPKTFECRGSRETTSVTGVLGFTDGFGVGSVGVRSVVLRLVPSFLCC